MTRKAGTKSFDVMKRLRATRGLLRGADDFRSGVSREITGETLPAHDR